MEAEPEIFIYENVKGMLSDKNGQTIKDFLQIFRESGYHCHYDVLNTKEHGVPQNRERVYIVGFKDVDLYHSFQFALKQKLTKRLKDVLEDDVDEKYYLSDRLIKTLFYTSSGTNGQFKPAICCNVDLYSSALTARYAKMGRQDPYIKVVSSDHIRKLTPRECLRLQDFPDTFKQTVSNSQMYRQSGNSMSVNILEMIFNQIEKAKSGEKHGNLLDFLGEE